MTISKLVSADEVAAVLGVTTARVYEMARQGVLPSVRLGRQIRFDPDRIKAWIDSGGQALSDGWRHDKEAKLLEIAKRSVQK